MHTVEIVTTTVPGFLSKLWKLVDDQATDDAICWNTNGTSFKIINQSNFTKNLLPLYFKHNNMASFVRQLNMYGFRKVTRIEQGGLRSENDEVEFYHPYFLKGQEAFLEFIKRKTPVGKVEAPQSKSEVGLVKEIMSDIKAIRTKQENVDTYLADMKKENETLWREVAILRQKHLQQQQVIEKLMHFLISLVQSGRNIGMKRKLPLMINDVSNSKSPRLSRSIEPSENETSNICPNTGPVIHDVTDLLTEEVSTDMPSNYRNLSTPSYSAASEPSPSEVPLSPLCSEPLELETILEMPSFLPNSELVKEDLVEKELQPSTSPVPPTKDDVPQSSSSTYNPSFNLPTQPLSVDDIFSNQKLSEISSILGPLTRDNLSQYVDSVASELDWLQEQLGSSNLPSGNISGVFEAKTSTADNMAESQLMQYVPSLLDLELFEADSPISDQQELLSTARDDVLNTPSVERPERLFESVLEKSPQTSYDKRKKM